MFLKLRNHLQANLYNLKGEWVQKSSYYESGICQALMMEQELDKERKRFWDARWREYLLEFKKGRSIWLDLVRYSEVTLKLNENACREVLSLFFIPDKDKKRIEEIICVETCAIIEKINLTERQAKMLDQLNKHFSRSLNAQLRVTVKDIKDIQLFAIK